MCSHLAAGQCSLTCSESTPIELHAGGTLRMVGNRVSYGYTGWTIKRGCAGILEWSDNVASGNYIGAYLDQGACTSLPLEVYRNSIGVGAHGSITQVSNVEAVENGIGLMNNEFLLPPEEVPSLSWRWSRGRTNWVDSVVVGRSRNSKALAKRDNCANRFGGHPYSNGGLMTPFRRFGDEWDYAGIQVTGSGDPFHAPSNAFVEIDNVTFVGFRGVDECGRKNVRSAPSPQSLVPGSWGRRAAPFSPFLIPPRAPRGVTPRS